MISAILVQGSADWGNKPTFFRSYFIFLLVNSTIQNSKTAQIAQFISTGWISSNVQTSLNWWRGHPSNGQSRQDIWIPVKNKYYKKKGRRKITAQQ